MSHTVYTIIPLFIHFCCSEADYDSGERGGLKEYKNKNKTLYTCFQYVFTAGKRFCLTENNIMPNLCPKLMDFEWL